MFFFSAERKPRRNKSRRSVELPKTHRWHLWSTSGGLDKVLSLTLRSFSLFLFFFFYCSRGVPLLPRATFHQGYVIHSPVRLAFTQMRSMLEMKCERQTRSNWTSAEHSAAQLPTVYSKAIVVLTDLMFFLLLLLCDWIMMADLWLLLQVSSGHFFCSAQCLNCWPGGCLGSPAFSRSPVVRRPRFAVSPAVSFLSVYCKDA